MIVFDKTWFDKHQKAIVLLLNNKLICKWLIGDIYINIVSISSNSIITEYNGTRSAHIFPNDFIANRIYSKLKYLWKLFHLWDMKIANRFCPVLNLGFDTLTVYAEGDPETDSFDAYLIEKDDTYSTANSSSIAEIVSDTSTLLLLRNCDYESSPRYFISRGLILFDTSSLGSCTINSASVHLYALSSSNFNEEDSGQAETVIVSASTASDSAVSAGDYDDMGSSSFSSKTMSSITNDAYNEFALNSSGLAQINKSGTSKFGLRLKGDIDVSQPSGANEAKFYSADYSSGTRAPKLVVNYTPEASTTKISMIV